MEVIEMEVLSEKAVEIDVDFEGEFVNEEMKQQAYEAGQKSMVDESKIIEKTVSGTNFIYVEDVSEIPHTVSVALSGDTLTDFSGVTVKATGKNLVNMFAPDKVSANKFDVVDDNTIRVYANRANTVGEQYYIKAPAGKKIAVSFDYELGGEATGSYNLINISGSNGTLKSGRVFEIPGDGQIVIEFARVGGKNDKNGWIDIKNFQVEINDTITDFEQYKGAEYIANANGSVDDVKSISPTMALLVDTEGVDISMTYWRSWGMQSEYERFWNAYQQNGKQTNYQNAFAGYGWTNETWKPKYNIKVLNGYMMFRYNQVKGDMVELLNDLGITLDDSECAMAAYMYFSCQFTRIGTVILTKHKNTGDMFAWCPNLQTIDKIVSNENVVFTASTFSGCYKLENITIDGVVGKDFTATDPPLTVESAKSVINALKDYSGTSQEYTYTLKLSDDCWARLEADSASPSGGTWIEYVEDLGWNT